VRSGAAVIGKRARPEPGQRQPAPAVEPAPAAESARADVPLRLEPRPSADVAPVDAAPPALEARGLSVHYGERHAVKDIDLTVPAKHVVALIGPSGCGKTTLLRCFNRMNDLLPTARVTGQVLFHGQNLYGPGTDAVEIRQRIGMVFQRPNPFPKSIFDNVAFGPRLNGHEGPLAEVVERSLRQVALWDEVKDRLKDSALALSGGQQQRLCIARALAVQPEIVLMDEPAAALDPIATQKVEDLIWELKERYTIVIVTHNMQQAARVSDYTAFLYMGDLIEYGPTDQIFTNPKQERTEAYVTGRFG
jgi:phosphate transport system ATP-binding protein